MESASIGVNHRLLSIAIGRDGGDGVVEVRDLFSLVFFPEALFIGELIFGV